MIPYSNAIFGWASTEMANASLSDSAIGRMAAACGRTVTDEGSTVGFSSLGQGYAYGGTARAWDYSESHGISILIKSRARVSSNATVHDEAYGCIAASLIESYRAAGRQFLAEIVGPFAIVLVDRSNQTVTIAVDRFGIERLCYSIDGKRIVFGTSAETVAVHPLVGDKVRPQAIFDYLFSHMIPSPETIFEHVEKLLPGQAVTLNQHGVHKEFYWSPTYAPSSLPPIALERQFRELLASAVMDAANRPDVGTFLSGGTDSSTVTGMLRKVSGKSPKTFSIGFDAQGFDEMDYARIAAQHFESQAHEYYVTPNDVAEAMPKIAAAFDEPFGNASAVPTYYCAKYARDHGVTLMLAGDGGDEIFGGNARYAKQLVFEHYQRLPHGLRGALSLASNKLSETNLLWPLRKVKSYVEQASVPLPDRLESYNFLVRTALDQIFEPDFLRVVNPEHPFSLMRESYSRTPSPSAIDRMMHLDLKVTLADNDLRKVTRMCELAGVDVGFPLLDERLFEFSGILSPEQKVSRGQLRVFFKHALRDFLPRAVLTKTKHGFGLPFGLWLTTTESLKRIVRDSFDSLGRRGVVKKSYLDGLLARHAQEHSSYFGVMIWVLVQLELWLDLHRKHL